MAKKKIDIVPMTQAELEALLGKHDAVSVNRPQTGAHAKLMHRDMTGLVFKERDLSSVDFTGSILCEANFERAKLDMAVFYACDLRKVNFRDASLVRADLRGACLRGAIMTGADMSGADLREGQFATFDPNTGLSFYHEKEAWVQGSGGVDLRGANLESVKMAGAIAINSNFEDANLNKAKLVRGNLSGANMTGSNLEGADLSSCVLKNVSLRDANLKGTMINYSELENVDMTGALTDVAVGKSLAGLALPLDDMLKLHQFWLRSRGAEGKRLDLSGYDMRGARSLAGADLTMMVAEESTWYGSEFVRSNLQASRFRGSDMRNCDFSTADLRGSDFSGAKMVGARLDHVRFEPLLLEGKRTMHTKFSGAVLRYVDFTKADLRKVDFSGADLSFADFTGADYSEANFLDANLSEAKIDLSKVKTI